jgi:hypothetical protein
MKQFRIVNWDGVDTEEHEKPLTSQCKKLSNELTALDIEKNNIPLELR